MQAVRQDNSGAVAHRPTRAPDDIVASRALAVDRVFKGGVLTVLGFGSALVIDLLALRPGLPLWISLGSALTAFGAGAIWAGSGASHLIRHGKRGSSLWLLSLAGLGGSLILNVGSNVLLAVLDSRMLEALNRLAMASCGLFGTALVVLGLIAIVRRMLITAD